MMEMGFLYQNKFKVVLENIGMLYVLIFYLKALNKLNQSINYVREFSFNIKRITVK